MSEWELDLRGPAVLVVTFVVLLIAAWLVKRRRPRDNAICGSVHVAGVCQRNAGHGGAHSYVTWPKGST